MENPTETAEVMGQISRIEALKRSLMHVLPLTITLVIHSFDLFNKYWKDLGAPHQNVILQAFQFAAKGHEMSMGLSLSAIVLHRIRYGLGVSGGVPLGLLPAGFWRCGSLAGLSLSFRMSLLEQFISVLVFQLS